MSPKRSPRLLRDPDPLRLVRDEPAPTKGRARPPRKYRYRDMADSLAPRLETAGFRVMPERDWIGYLNIGELDPGDPRIAVREFHFMWPVDPDTFRDVPWQTKHGWRSDFYFPAARLIVEVDGGLHMRKKGAVGGHHATQEDMNKINTASLLDLTVFRFSTVTLRDAPLVVVESIQAAVFYITGTKVVSAGNR